MLKQKHNRYFHQQLEAEIISLEAKAKESAAAVSEIEESKVENNFSNPEDEIEM